MPTRPSGLAVVAVATSGGRDSTALLHAVLRQSVSAGVRVLALHVQHGLQPAAESWLARVQAQCERWARQGWPLSFACERLNSSPLPGESVEAWARRERYAALARMALSAGARHVLLAHHRGDQAETVLLQALRGGGPAGLAAMPAAQERDGICWLRPWLQQPRTAIDAYIKRWRLSHVEDDSNANTAFDRNRLRLEVWPTLSRAFPGVEQALCDVAQQAALADAFIRETTTQCLGALQGEAGLDAMAWGQLSLAQRHWVMRQWLMQQLGQGVSAQVLRRLNQEAMGLRTGRWPLIPGRELRLYRGRFSVAAVTLLPLDDLPNPLVHTDAIPWPTHVSTGSLALPHWGGVLEWQVADRGGVHPQSLAGAVLRARSGGEHFQLGPGRPPRALKKQFQSLGVSMWARSGPLLWQGERLVFVPGLGVDARCQAAPGEPQLVLHWRPDTVASAAPL